VLLRDGYDELAIRLSYSRARDHLQTLLNALQGRAKTVLTSRSSSFRPADHTLEPIAGKVRKNPNLTSLSLRSQHGRIGQPASVSRDQISEFLRERYASQKPQPGTDSPTRLAVEGSDDRRHVPPPFRGEER
jgi:hypothetical protein